MPPAQHPHPRIPRLDDAQHALRPAAAGHRAAVRHERLILGLVLRRRRRQGGRAVEAEPVRAGARPVVDVDVDVRVGSRVRGRVVVFILGPVGRDGLVVVVPVISLLGLAGVVELGGCGGQRAGFDPFVRGIERGACLTVF